MNAVEPSTFQVPGEDLDVRYYADLLWRGRYLVLTTAVVAGVLGTMIAFLQIPEYRAEAVLQIKPETPPFMNVSEAAYMWGGYWGNQDYYNTQYRLLRSKPVAQGVVDRLKLTDKSPFKDAADPAAIIQAHVTITPIVETQLVTVSITHRDPKEAALWANTLSETYVERALETRIEAARTAYEWLQERLSSTQEGMSEAQDRLFEMYKSQDLFVPEGAVSVVSGSITKLNTDFVEAQARRITLEAGLQQAHAFRARGKSLDAIPQIASDGEVGQFDRQLAAADLELTELKERYKEGHPKVQEVIAQQQHLLSAKATRADEIIEAMRVEFEQLKRREAELKQAVDDRMSQAAGQSQRGAQLEALRSESESAKGLYDVLLQKLNESDIAASIRTNNITLVERATPPGAPVFPNKPRIAGLGLAIGLFLGVGLVLGRDYLDNTVKSPEDLERFLHLDLLAAVPRYEQLEGDHLVTEAYQNLRTALIFARTEGRGHVVLVASTAPQEGKTTTIVNMARLLASAGERTVALDFDMRRASIHQEFGLSREPGASDALIGKRDLDACLRQTSDENLTILTAGALPPNPPALLARKAMSDLIENLRDRFEWILIDSPPLASVTDALLLARVADSTVVVVQHNKIDKKLVRRSVASLRKVSASVLGAVLNVVDVKAQGYSYYYYPREEKRAGNVKTAKASAKA